MTTIILEVSADMVSKLQELIEFCPAGTGDYKSNQKMVEREVGMLGSEITVVVEKDVKN